MSNQTPAEKLAFNYYPVYVTEAFTYTEAVLQFAGVPTTKNKKQDAERANRLKAMQYPIMTIAELFDQGATIELINPKDSIPMYKAIVEYLEIRRHDAERAFHTEKVPLDALRKLDELATWLFKIVRNVDANYIVHSKAAPPLTSLMTRRQVRKRTYVEAVEELKVKDENGHVLPEEHRPITSAIDKAVFGRNNNR